MPGYKNRDGRGRKPATNSVRFIMVGKGKRLVRFILSEDVVLRLSLHTARLAQQNYLKLYMRFERFPWDAPHALLIQLSAVPFIEDTSRTYKLTKQRNGPRYTCVARADLFEVKPGVRGAKFDDIHFDNKRRGMVVQFPLDRLTDEAQDRWDRIARWRLTKQGAMT